jgi:hypothetical protein
LLLSQGESDRDAQKPKCPIHKSYSSVTTNWSRQLSGKYLQRKHPMLAVRLRGERSGQQKGRTQQEDYLRTTTYGSACFLRCVLVMKIHRNTHCKWLHYQEYLTRVTVELMKAKGCGLGFVRCAARATPFVPSTRNPPSNVGVRGTLGRMLGVLVYTPVDNERQFWGCLFTCLNRVLAEILGPTSAAEAARIAVWRQIDFAEETGIHENYVSDLERGGRTSACEPCRWSRRHSISRFQSWSRRSASHRASAARRINSSSGAIDCTSDSGP